MGEFLLHLKKEELAAGRNQRRFFNAGRTF
jgi:hypothetical protein